MTDETMNPTFRNEEGVPTGQPIPESQHLRFVALTWIQEFLAVEPDDFLIEASVNEKGKDVVAPGYNEAVAAVRLCQANIANSLLQTSFVIQKVEVELEAMKEFRDKQKPDYSSLSGLSQ